jgi:hypothetical protein
VRKIVLRPSELQEPTFATADEALRNASTPDRKNKAEADTTLLKDATLTAGSYGDGALELWLSNGLTLTIEARGPRVEWNLEPTCVRPPRATSSSEPVVLVYPGNPDLSTIWDRQKLLADRIGKKVQMVFAGHAWLYLYMESSMILLFVSQEIEGSARELLSWAETD